MKRCFFLVLDLCNSAEYFFVWSVVGREQRAACQREGGGGDIGAVLRENEGVAAVAGPKYIGLEIECLCVPFGRELQIAVGGSYAAIVGVDADDVMAAVCFVVGIEGEFDGDIAATPYETVACCGGVCRDGGRCGVGEGRKDVKRVYRVVAAAGHAGVCGIVYAAYDKQIIAGGENAFFAVELRLEEVVEFCAACDDCFAATGFEYGYEHGLGCKGVVFGMEPDGDGIAVAVLVIGRFVIAVLVDDEVFAACLYGKEGNSVPRVIDVGYMICGTVVDKGIAIGLGGCGAAVAVGIVGGGIYFFICIFTHSNIVFRGE